MSRTNDLSIRSLVSRSAILLNLIASFAISGCGSDDVIQPEVGPWHPLGLFSDAFNNSWIEGDTLYVAAGVSGVYRRSPVIDGEWSFEGYAYPSLVIKSGADSGPNVIMTAGQEVLISFLRISTVPPLIRANFDSISSWHASDTGMQRGQIYDIRRLGDASFLAANSRGFYLSSDNALTWSQVHWAITYRISFSPAGRRIYAGGKKDHLPYLAYSDNDGLEWNEIPTAGKFPPETAITSLTTSQSRLLVMTDSGPFWSPDSGSTFNHFLSTAASGGVFANPANKEVLVVADSVYYSADFPDSWISLPLAGRRLAAGSLAPSAITVDWIDRYAIIPILEHDTGQLYLFDFSGIQQ